MIIGIVRPCVKHLPYVINVSDLAHTILISQVLNKIVRQVSDSHILPDTDTAQAAPYLTSDIRTVH